MTSRNDITGDLISSKEVTDAFRENFDRIFGKKEVFPSEAELKARITGIPADAKSSETKEEE